MYAAVSTPIVPTFTPMPSRVSALEVTGAKTIAGLSRAYYVVGTMGLLTPEFMEQRSATSTWGVRYEHTKEAIAQAAEQVAYTVALQPTPAEDLTRIREVLKPAVLELANLFGVSRQAVYDWQAGAQPSAEAVSKLAELARAADIFFVAGVAVNSQTLRRKVAGGGTLLDAVLNGGNAVQVAQSLVKTLLREAGQRQQLSQQLAGRKRGLANVADYGAPGLADEA